MQRWSTRRSLLLSETICPHQHAPPPPSARSLDSSHHSHPTAPSPPTPREEEHHPPLRRSRTRTRAWHCWQHPANTTWSPCHNIAERSEHTRSVQAATLIDLAHSPPPNVKKICVLPKAQTQRAKHVFAGRVMKGNTALLHKRRSNSLARDVTQELIRWTHRALAWPQRRTRCWQSRTSGTMLWRRSVVELDPAGVRRTRAPSHTSAEPSRRMYSSQETQHEARVEHHTGEAHAADVAHSWRDARVKQLPNDSTRCEHCTTSQHGAHGRSRSTQQKFTGLPTCCTKQIQLTLVQL